MNTDLLRLIYLSSLANSHDYADLDDVRQLSGLSTLQYIRDMAEIDEAPGLIDVRTDDITQATISRRLADMMAPKVGLADQLSFYLRINGAPAKVRNYLCGPDVQVEPFEHDADIAIRLMQQQARDWKPLPAFITALTTTWLHARDPRKRIDADFYTARMHQVVSAVTNRCALAHRPDGRHYIATIVDLLDAMAVDGETEVTWLDAEGNRDSM